jgi:hypothetical protein
MIVKIRVSDLKKEHLETGVALFVPGYNSYVSKNEDGTYHLPTPSGPVNLETAYNFVRSFSPLGHVWVTCSDQEAGKLLADSLWRDKYTNTGLRLFHEKPRLYCVEDNGFRLMRCDCCDDVLGYGASSHEGHNLICGSCMKNCYNIECDHK